MEIPCIECQTMFLLKFNLLNLKPIDWKFPLMKNWESF